MRDVHDVHDVQDVQGGPTCWTYMVGRTRWTDVHGDVDVQDIHGGRAGHTWWTDVQTYTSGWTCGDVHGRTYTSADDPRSEGTDFRAEGSDSGRKIFRNLGVWRCFCEAITGWVCIELRILLR